MAWDKKSYDAEYYKKNIFCKRLPFNRSIPEDMELLKFLDRQQPNATQYLKQLIRKDMERQRTEEAENSNLMEPPIPRVIGGSTDDTAEIPILLVSGGFKDDAAIREAAENSHRIRTELIHGRWEITIDLDSRKVLREIDRGSPYSFD